MLPTTSAVADQSPSGRGAATGCCTVLAASVSFDPQGRTATLVPDEPLEAGRYKVTLTTGVVDWSGNRFGGATWTFDATT